MKQYKSFINIPILLLTLIVGLSLAMVLPWLAGSHSNAAVSQVELAHQDAPQADKKYYVAKTGDGTDGLSWTTAFTNVQDALAAASTPAVIWVA